MCTCLKWWGCSKLDNARAIIESMTPRKARHRACLSPIRVISSVTSCYQLANTYNELNRGYGPAFQPVSMGSWFRDVGRPALLEAVAGVCDRIDTEFGASKCILISIFLFDELC